MFAGFAVAFSVGMRISATTIAVYFLVNFISISLAWEEEIKERQEQLNHKLECQKKTLEIMEKLELEFNNEKNELQRDLNKFFHQQRI